MEAEPDFPTVDLDEDSDTDPDPGFLPPGCDLFPNFTPENVEAMKGAGRAPTTIRVMRFHNGRRDTIAGQWPIETASTAWLVQTFGAGIYDVQCLDQFNQFMKQKRHSLQQAPPYAQAQQAGAHGMPNGAPYGPPPGYAPPYMAPPPMYGQQPYPYPYPPPQPAPAKDALGISELIKVLTLSMTANSANVQNQLRIAEVQAKNAGPGPETRMMMELVKDALQAKSRKAQPGMDLGDIVGLMKLGAQLQNPGDDDEWWKEFVPQLANSVGPGALAVLAASILKEDKAQNVLDLMEQHMKNTQVRDAEGESVSE